MKKTFKDFLAEVPQPKKITLETPLPYVFDLYWDAKTFRELLGRTHDHCLTAKMVRLLAQEGFDTKNLPFLYD